MPRDRSREGAGKSANSFVKHRFVGAAARSQAFSYRYMHPDERIALIDGNAGDGEGVATPEVDLFEGQTPSLTTPEILTEIAEKIGNADVFLCESNRHKRARLAELFPRATIVANHKHAPTHLLPEHRYVLWLSDPCGPKGHGVETMAQIAQTPGVRSDFVVVFNEGFIIRLNGTDATMWEPHRDIYGPMAEPLWWARELRKTQVAQSRLIKQSNNFKFRLLVLSNHIADYARRHFTIFRSMPLLIASKDTAP